MELNQSIRVLYLLGGNTSFVFKWKASLIEKIWILWFNVNIRKVLASLSSRFLTEMALVAVSFSFRMYRNGCRTILAELLRGSSVRRKCENAFSGEDEQNCKVAYMHEKLLYQFFPHPHLRSFRHPYPSPPSLPLLIHWSFPNFFNDCGIQNVHHPFANNESSEVCGHLLRVTYLI